MNARATEQAATTDERFVVWSPDTTTCMIWTSRARAEQFAQFWRDTRLLGSHGWRVGRVGRVVGEPCELETASPAMRQALAAADPTLQGDAAAGWLQPRRMQPARIGSQLPNSASEAELLPRGRPDVGQPDVGQPDVGQPDLGQPDMGQPDREQFGITQPDTGRPGTTAGSKTERLRTQQPQAGYRGGRGTADDTLATARDEFVALLAAKDALIAQLRHQVNDLTLATVREATAQGRRIAELERRLAESTRRGGGR